MAEPANPTGPFYGTPCGQDILMHIKLDICSVCDKNVIPRTVDSGGTFKDEQSVKEFCLSGLCQDCQDRTFTPSEEE